MLYRMEKLIGLSIQAADVEVGKIKDIYFDDHLWAVRYLVVDTGRWLDGPEVLIPPITVQGIDWDKRTIQVRLTRRQVRTSPHVDTDKPVSRQHDVDFFDYHGYPCYRSGPRALADPHLRSANDVIGYHLRTTSDSVGHLEDFLVDDASWSIRYIVVDTRSWSPGKHVVIPPQWISGLDWADKTVVVDVARDMVQGAPEYDPATDFSRPLEASLHQHYQRPGYWQ